MTVETYAWFIKHWDRLNPDAYGVVICDEAHTALGERTSATIRRFHRPTYIGMTATDQLLQKHVGDVFPAEIADFPLADAVRRGVVAPLRALRVQPGASLRNVPVVGGDYDQKLLAAALDHDALNMAAAMYYADRFGERAGIVYAAGVDHAERVAAAMRAAGVRARSVSGRTPPRVLAETLAAYERGETNVLVNAQLLAEGWNAPRATICMHLAPTASRRVYQQRIGRIMRLHRRKEAGVVVDFADPAAPHSDRTVTLHSLLDADVYRPGALVTPKPPRRRQRWRRQARPVVREADWLVPVAEDPARRRAVIAETGRWSRRPPAARRAGAVGRDRRAPRRPGRPAEARRDAGEGRGAHAHRLLRHRAAECKHRRLRRPRSATSPRGGRTRTRWIASCAWSRRRRPGSTTARRARACCCSRSPRAPQRLLVAAPQLDLAPGARVARGAVPRRHGREIRRCATCCAGSPPARRGAPGRAARLIVPPRQGAAAGRRRRAAGRRGQPGPGRLAQDGQGPRRAAGTRPRSWRPRSRATCPS